MVSVPGTIPAIFPEMRQNISNVRREGFLKMLNQNNLRVNKRFIVHCDINQ